MKLDYRADGRLMPILEVGDLVRLTRAEAGPTPTAQAGDWGGIRRIAAKGRAGHKIGEEVSLERAA